MSQKTNLNVNPYYDDFDSTKNFLKVLFKPGYPVQSRELTTLQSILQNQVEKFGTHIFKEGSVVIPGNPSYDGQFYAVKLNTTQFGIDISLYIDRFVGETITGQVSGVTARVQKVVLPTESDDVEYITLYVKYLESDNNSQFTQFQDGELLTSNKNVVYGNTTINSGTPFASAINSDATAIGSSASIANGVYFIRGYFVNVLDQTILLDFYTNTPSYRVGLEINESLINAKDDESLFDNAKGFSNYASPGADRLQITLTLAKRSLTDTNDTNFVELLRLKNGKVKKIITKTTYNLIRDELARRTFDESGNYTVNSFDLDLEESLNNRLGNDGVYFSNEKTDEGNTPSDNLSALKISPGKAYVKGYDIEKISSTTIDIDKPRDTEDIKNVTVPFEMGNILKVNNVTGLAHLRKTIQLYSQLGGVGGQIGEARVYSFNLTDSPYIDATTSWDLRLYDIQTYTLLTLNSAVTASDLKESFLIKGKSTGASGFAIADGASDEIFLRQTSGTFAKGEILLINGIESSRSVKEVRAYNTQNIKSVKQAIDGNLPEFKADSILDLFSFPGSISQLTITAVDTGTGISTVTSPGRTFVGINTDTVIRYQQAGLSTETYNRVTSVAADALSFEISGISDGSSGISNVLGVFEGGLPTSEIQVNGFLGAPVIKGSGTLFAPLPEQNASAVDLSTSQLFVIEQLAGQNISNNTLTLNISGITSLPNSTWVNFDQERFSLTDSSGVIAPLSSDAFSQTSSVVTIKGLTNSSNNVVNVTALKTGIQSKTKNYDRSRVIFVNRSKLKESGTATATSKNDGLTYNEYYGLRVQDEEISLNYPDVSKVVAVYESLNSSDPTLDVLTFAGIANVGSNAIIGENIIGPNSGAVARIVSNSTTSPLATNNVNKLGIVYLNDKTFDVGEVLKFEESQLNAQIDSIEYGDYSNITQSFKLNRGQKNQYYDYSRIVRNKNTQEPSRRLLVIFDHYTVPANDVGDVFTVDSYDSERFSKDIPNIGGSIRATDTLDFRPRVAVFDPSTTTDRSPFDFNTRTTALTGSPSRLMAPEEGSIISQSFYLPRIDKIYLDILGNFVVDKGVSSKNPKPPTKKGEFLELGTIEYPAYLYNASDANIILTDNRRYTMRDIGIIEDRVENLERVTTLSLLEVNTQTLQIKDSEGSDRFKSGFFVDDFSDDSRFDTFESTTLVDQDSRTLNSDISSNSLESLVATLNNFTPENIDLSSDKYSTTPLVLLDSNVEKTGNSLTLAYDQIDWLEQPFATKIENVNPFNIVVYNGTVTLNPAVDNWTRTVQLADRNVDRGITRRNNVSLTNNLSSNTRSNVFVRGGEGRELRRNAARQAGNFSFSTSSTSRGSFDTVDTSVRNEVVGTNDQFFIRSRNVEFNASNLKPNTRYYQFLDGRSEVDVIPKLIEIENVSAAFTVGETVIGSIGGVERIRFRVCRPDHKSGSISSPDSTYNQNPYNKSQILGSVYSSTSNVLNVDVNALSKRAQGEYFGYIQSGMQLVGQTSNAIASVKNIRLISDNFGDLNGSFFIRPPHANPTPSVRLRAGTKTYKLTSSSTNDKGLPGSNEISFAETSYTANGTVLRFQATVTRETTRTDISSTTNFNLTRSVNVEYTDPLAQTFTVGGNIQVKSDIDTDDDVNGVFLTSVDVFFARIDSGNAPIRVEVRETQLGTPTLTTIGKPVTLRPRGSVNGVETQLIQTSNTGEIATNVRFPEPIFLAPGREYAIVLISDQSDEYEVWTAVMGDKTVNTQQLPDVDQVIYTKQFALGSLFKSQNGSIWSTDQNQDLKFKLYKAEFTQSSGTAYFYNPPLDQSNDYVSKLINNPITVLPKTGRIGIDTVDPNTAAHMITTLGVGRKLAGGFNNDGSAIIVGQGSSVSDATTLTEAGQNYPASASNVVVSTFNYSGKGEGLKLRITTNSNGVITGVAHSAFHPDYGSGYQVGDVVGIVTSSTSTETGRDARITIAAVHGVDTLYLTNVQGEFGGSGTNREFSVGAAVSYYSDPTTIVSVAGTTIISSTADGGIYSGNYFKVDHFNHGMYSRTNKLVIDNIKSDVPATVLNSELTVGETSSINVGSTADFTTFEGQTVDGTNLGYVKIGGEIIAYNNASGNTLTINSNGRGIDGTIAINHSVNSVVEKYEFGGVSLRRISGINTAISPDASSSNDVPIDIDSYYVKIDRSNTKGIDRSSDGSISPTKNYPQLSFNDEKLIGGDSVTASENLVFNSINPSYDITTPGSTTFATAKVRTTTATSVDGQEVSFNDNGYEDVQLNSMNSLSSLRMVASEVNQNEYLTSLPRNKSFTTAITFTSNDPNNALSPILNLDQAGSILNINRLNKPITDYPNDNRVNSIVDDPHSSVYYSNITTLQNPASGLKVIISAERPGDADFRLLYTTVKADSSEIEQSYDLFPGYDNLKQTTEGFLVVDPSKNSGLPDRKVRESLDGEFLEYEFTVDNLDLFTGYGIKIVMSSSNQSQAPRFADLRIIALR
jgi:hypothetical protein